ncbi:MAG: arylsulfatase [Lentisphaeraceae bacterium]|nr:arylsulfatase [Lentisphaeraceae bacterium]
MMLIVSLTPALQATANKKPNIVFILADDLGYNDLSCFGQKNFKTPFLDEMAQEGMKFTQHYAGSTVCGPSRCSLLTGLHSGNSYIRGNGPHVLPADPAEPTVASHIRQAGYVTAMIGKSGIACDNYDPKRPNEKGFDYFYGYLAHKAAHRHYPTHLWKNGTKVNFPGNQGKRGDTNANDIIIDDSIRFIKENQKKPFFLHIALTSPHADLIAPEKYVKKYRGKLGKEKPYKAGYYAESKEPKAAFAGMVTHIDQRIGDFLKELKKLGLDKNTLVIFTSDNGTHKEGGHSFEALDSNGILRGGKRDLYEGGVRVPMIAWWPGKIKAASVSKHVSAFWDFMPTALDLAGYKKKVRTDGISYLPVMLGEKQKKHDYLYWEFYGADGKQAVLWGEWKAVRVGMHEKKDPKFQLFNIDKDPSENNDLAAQNPELIKEIRQIVKKAHSESKIFKFRGNK